MIEKKSEFEFWEIKHYLENVSKMDNIPDNAKVIITWFDNDSSPFT